MTGANADDSPLAAAAGPDGAHARDALGLLGNETRLAILLALWEAYDPHADGEGVAFSTLRERVGVADSGRFNYHLRKLDDHFVRKTDDGYALRPLGLQLVQTIIAGTGRSASLPRAPIDAACHRCGADTAVTYEDGWLYHVCTECEGEFGDTSRALRGVLFAEPFPAAALADRTPEELFATGVFRLLQAVRTKVGGLCPRCAGAIDTTVSVCAHHDASADETCPNCGNAAAARVRWVCPICKYDGASAPATAMVVHPAVVAFYHDHGVDIDAAGRDLETAARVLELLRAHDQDVVSTDPVRIGVTVRYGDDELGLVVDDTLTAVDDGPAGD